MSLEVFQLLENEPFDNSVIKKVSKSISSAGSSIERSISKYRIHIW